jgi:ATP-dependent protease ClpP protease subunit
MAALPEYRENPNRCVYVTGKINQELVDRLTPAITDLRHSGSAPITVYIDSVGGNTSNARLIMNLLRTPTQDGSKCKIITIATGIAASAAADLLVWGDYAIAYPHARVWFHGTRQPTGDRVTTEDALLMAESLKQRNEGFALALANAAFSRFFFRYMNFRPDFGQMRESNSRMQDVQCLAISIMVKLSTDFGIPVGAMMKHDRLSELTEYLSRQEQRDKNLPKDEIQLQAKLLKRLIDFKVKEKKREKEKEPGWSFSKNGLADLQQDFSLFLDYQSGDHMRNLEHRVISWGPLCLDDTESEEYKNVPPETKKEWLITKAQPKIKPLWHLLVSICRLLQQGEHFITATDAYWLGLIDEVIGVKLPSERLIMEDRAEKAAMEEAAKKTASLSESTTRPTLPEPFLT